MVKKKNIFKTYNKVSALITILLYFVMFINENYKSHSEIFILSFILGIPFFITILGTCLFLFIAFIFQSTPFIQNKISKNSEYKSNKNQSFISFILFILLLIPLLQICLKVFKSQSDFKSVQKLNEENKKKSVVDHKINCQLYASKSLTVKTIFHIYDNCTMNVELFEVNPTLKIITKANEDQRNRNCAVFKSSLTSANLEHKVITVKADDFDTCMSHPAQFEANTFLYGEVLIDGIKFETPLNEPHS